MDTQWQTAFAWLSARRRHHPPHSDVWHLRFHWRTEQVRLWQDVQSCRYRLSPMQVHRSRGGSSTVMWDAADALVLKWAALHLQRILPLHEQCTHPTGHGGVTGSLRQVAEALQTQRYRFVWRTDIRGYYRHIRKSQAYAHVRNRVSCPVLLNLVRLYLYYSVEDGGDIRTPASGIPRGSALSPLIGGSLLYHVDADMSGRNDGLFYTRYMDDFLLLSERRWPLRRTIRDLHGWFDVGGFETHPDKTNLGRTERGFDWLGIDFTAAGATGVAERAKTNHLLKRGRLYEQSRRRGLSEEETLARLYAYEDRWTMWAETMMRAGSGHE